MDLKKIASAVPIIGGALGLLFGKGKQTNTQTTQRDLTTPLDQWAKTTKPQINYKPASKTEMHDLYQGAKDSGLKNYQDIQAYMADKGWSLGKNVNTGEDMTSGTWHRLVPLKPSEIQPQAGLQNEFQNDYLDLLRGQIGDANSGEGGFSPEFASASYADAAHASASHALASLIDLNDVAFQPEPPANLREDIYGRLNSGADAAADNQISSIMDSARRSGVGPDAPWVQSLIQKAKREAQKSATQGLTDFFDQFVQAALGRRAGAEGQNASMLTNVSEFNAGADNSVSMFNAGSDNAVSMFNAGADNSVGMFNAGQANKSNEFNASLERDKLNDIFNNIKWLNTPFDAGSTTTQSSQYNPNVADYVSGAGKLLQDYLKSKDDEENAKGRTVHV